MAREYSLERLPLDAFGGDSLELVLRYRGPLPPTNDRKKHVPLKHLIRQKFHSQLQYHWQHDNYLAVYFPGSKESLAQLVEARDPARVSRAWCKCTLGKFQFVPLVVHSPSFRLICELDIRFATRDTPGNVVNGGDLDNRIKTLFDALRMPSPGLITELPPNSEPTDTETPFLCLLEDDRLITKFAVASERLLEAPLEGEKESDVLLTIYAKITPNPFGTGEHNAVGSFPV